MRRPQLEHIIRAATGITGATEFVIVGSQAMLGQFPQAPDELLVSIEADIFSLRNSADSDLIQKEGRTAGTNECDEGGVRLLAAMDEAIAKADATPGQEHSARDVRARLNEWTSK